MPLDACGLRPVAPRSGLGLSLSLLLLLSACSQVRKLSPADAFSDEDKLNYLVLAAIAPDEAQQYASAGSATSRADFLEWFWRNPPPGLNPTPDSLLSTPQSFFRQRALQARTYFGTTDLLNDDRVRTYISYGPARREQYEPQLLSVPVAGEDRADHLCFEVQPDEGQLRRESPLSRDAPGRPPLRAS